MSAQSGWYPDPGGGQGLYRFWDGNAWSAATSPNPAAPPPSSVVGAVPPPGPVGSPVSGQGYGQTGSGGYGTGAYGRTGSAAYGQGAASSSGSSTRPTTPAGPLPYGEQGPSSYAQYQQTQGKRRTPLGWWLGAAALLVVIVVIAAFVIRGIGNGSLTGGRTGGQATTRLCPQVVLPTAPSDPQPRDGRVHGGPVSYPELGTPWSLPQAEYRVPFGSDVQSQEVEVQKDYVPNSDWVASIVVGELQAGDGFFSPQQGSQIVVRCIIGTFYGENQVTSDVKVNKATTVDGHDAWLVESHLSFDIPHLLTKGELLIVEIVDDGATAGLYYASIPDTVPKLVAPARTALKDLRVDR